MIMAEFIKWTFVVFLVINALGCIWAIGRPREPMKHGTAATVVLINALIVAAVLAYWRS
jgi:hypothetical protein